MTIFADESVESQIVSALRRRGHRVEYAAEIASGCDDGPLLERARILDATFLTSDKDFGELVFRQRMLSSGVILLRLMGLSNERKADLVVSSIDEHKDRLSGSFMVVSPGNVRIRPMA